MQILAINSSARVGVESKTEIMLDNLVKGMREAGADVDVVNLHKKKINYCVGCFTCWTKTPGQCLHRDDMSKEIIPKIIASDLLVLATPLYHFTVNAHLKAVIERTLPMAQPFIEHRDGVSHHPPRYDFPNVVVLSVAGFPELSVFDQLKIYVNFLYKGRLVAEIYRTAAETMSGSHSSAGVRDVLEATVQGGRELVESQKISEQTMTRIQQPLQNYEAMASAANLVWQACIEEKITLREFHEKGMIPRPNSLETYGAVMKIGFNSEKAGDAKAVMQFVFSGQVTGECYFTIKEGSFEFSTGTAKDPDVTITAPFEVWMDIMTGKADGQQMFMEQKYKIEGDLSLLMRMNDFFGG